MLDFDVVKHLPQDIMHMFLEGIFPLHMEQLLNYISNEASLLCLEQINSHILGFTYAHFNQKSSPLNGISLRESVW